MADSAALGHGQGRRIAGADAGGSTRVRWRIAERVISVCVGGAAVSGAIYLGVTGPLLSPVSPAAAAQVVTGSATGANDAGGTQGNNGATGSHGDDGGFDRGRAGDVGGHR
jgi:hypothetical protein